LDFNPNSEVGGTGLRLKVPVAFYRQRDEHRLRHILRQVRIAHQPDRRRIYLIEVPPHQFSEGRLRAVIGVGVQQLQIGLAIHHPW
jgi:hypothetical protein